MQSLNRVRIAADDVVVASDHGRDLLDYVLPDLAAGSRARPSAVSRAARAGCACRVVRTLTCGPAAAGGSPCRRPGGVAGRSGPAG